MATTTDCWKPKDKTKEEWVHTYVEKLKEAGKYELRIWPTHCVEKTKGIEIYQPIDNAIHSWLTGAEAAKQERFLEWLHKGMGLDYEMYSALKAEVETSDDGSKMNTDAVNKWKSFDRVFFAGQAKDYCVKSTVEDYIQELSKTDKSLISKITILEDCTSSVDPKDTAGKQFLDSAKKAGAKVMNSTDVLNISEKKVLLVIIDPQNDFHEAYGDTGEDGSLKVVGSKANAENLVKFIEANAMNIQSIVVTIDSHKPHPHIFNQGYWKNSKGESPKPFDVIEQKDLCPLPVNSNPPKDTTSSAHSNSAWICFAVVFVRMLFF